MASRRAFLGGGAAAMTSMLLSRDPPAAAAASAGRLRILKPPRLAPGDAIALINPVGAPLRAGDVEAVTSSLQGLGMQVKRGSRVGEGARGLPSGDRERAGEINELFADPTVKALVPVRGGWGSARLLPYLDYELIRRHPKILMGFSDAGALLLGVHARTGLVTFHGPMGVSPWVPFTVESMRPVLFAGEAATLHTPGTAAGEGETAWRTLAPGRARGRLLGGNLTVVSSVVGSPYLDDASNLILFLEEVREPTSEVDRMLTQLELAGVLGRARGLVFGQCTRCAPPALDGALTLEQVLLDHVRRLHIPAWQGAPIGHVERQLTLPIGLPVEIDASRGTIQLLEPAVT